MDFRRWAALRRVILQRDDHRCRACSRAGKLEVDHVVPLARGGAWWAPENLQALCRACHFEKTGRENRRRRVEGPAVRKWRALVANMR